MKLPRLHAFLLAGVCTGLLHAGEPASTPPGSALPSSLRLTALAASAGSRVGLANLGFWGIPVRPGTSYRASFYARVDAESPRVVTLAVENPDGSAAFARTQVTLAPGGWKRYEAILTTAASAPVTAQARFLLTVEEPGTLWLSLVSLFPPTFHDRPNGFRIDLMEKLAALRPKFLRFPGGNYLEGNTLPERYEWKKTLGPLVERAGHMGPWGYRSSDGLGLLEFFHWCEDLQVEPVLGVFAGLTLDQKFVKPGPDLAPYVQEALDEIEYITGSAATKWGARRAADGHPAPFSLTYVEIGNEDWPDACEYDARFAQFYDAIKARYPALQLIATKPVKSRTPDVVDDHYYRQAEDFFQDVHHYDLADRKGPKIFVGEWATMEGTPTPNLHAALGDAAWMTGMERNSDLIIMQAYAPLLTNVNPKAAQWQTNLIGYDALTSFGSPSYHAQVMFNAQRGDEILASSAAIATGMFHSVTRDRASGQIFVKVVNALGTPRRVHLDIAGAGKLAAEAELTVLSSARPEDTNTLAEPAKVVPIASAERIAGAAFDHTFPAYSITVLALRPEK